MGHDPTKILLGTTQSSDRPFKNVYSSDPLEFYAGLAVRVNSSGLLSISSESGEWSGISLGKSLSDSFKTDVIRSGSRVPLITEDDASFVSIGAPVYIDNETGKATGNFLGSSLSNAVYVSQIMIGVKEDGSTVPCVLVDMIGGL